MAEFSDQLLVVTILAYLATMVAHAAEYALGAQRGAAAESAPARSAPAREPALAGTSASAGDATPADAGGDGRRGEEAATATPAAVPAEAQGGWRSLDRMGWVAVGALLLAALAHATTTVTRAVAAERLPWGNMYEFTLTTTLVGVVAWLVVLYRQPALRHLGLYVSLVSVLLLGLVGTVAYTPVQPQVAPLNSYWFTIHVSAAAVAAAVFMVGFVVLAMYLVRNGYEAGRRRFPFPIGGRLPAATVLERVGFRLHTFAFPLWTFAVVAGAIWAEVSWGRYWGWDPKEIWAFVSWVFYAAYLHARATPSVRRTVVAWLAIAGFASILMNLFGVNLFFDSLHSYA